jgi:hypothetical protein
MENYASLISHDCLNVCENCSLYKYESVLDTVHCLNLSHMTDIGCRLFRQVIIVVLTDFRDFYISKC